MDDEMDTDAYSSLSPLTGIEEQDFYELANVNSSARKAEIHESYKRRTLEIHLNKNTAHTVHALQATKLTYETLYDGKRRMSHDVNMDYDNNDGNYDDENNGELFFTIENEQIRSHIGRNLSDMYKEQIACYLREYENLTFFNNFNEKLGEIIARSIESSASSMPIDNYIQCPVCHQSCKDINIHKQERYEPYKQIFHNTTTSIPFEQMIDTNIWNWKPVERTLAHLSIWNMNDKWKQLSHIILQLHESIQILCKSNRYWTLLIDTYERYKEELVKLITLLSQVTVINYLPDVKEIQTLKSAFGKYDQVEQRHIFSKIWNQDERVTSGNYYLVDTTTTTNNKYINIKDFCFPIAEPPSEIYREYCYDCQRPFSFFTRHHHCRMCGQQFCNDCMMYKRIPHFGYIIKPVRICHKCSDEKQYLIYQHLLTYVKHLTESKRFQYLNIYLALLYQYKPDGNELFYRQTGLYCYELGQYLLTLQCFTYARLTSDEWFQYTIDFCKKNEYLYSFTCMKLSNKSDSFWLEQANSQRNSTYALLCYENIKLSIKQLFEIASQQLSSDLHACLSYLVYLNIKNPTGINWKEFGEEILLKTNYDGSLAMFCFYLYGKMQDNDWYEIVKQLCHSNQFDKLAYLLSYLYHIQQIDYRASENTYIYFMTKMLIYHQTISLDDWLNDICYGWSLDLDRMIIGLAMTYIYKYISWIEYKNDYILRKDYFKTLICHKMAEYLNENNETQWLINSIEDFDPIGYELYNSINQVSDWKQLADQYFQDKKFEIALNCYLYCPQNDVDQIILQQAQSPLLPLTTALLYYTVVYKRLRGNNSKILSKKNGLRCNNTFYNICLLLAEQQNPYIFELVKSAMNMYETEDLLTDRDLLKYHVIILKELAKSNENNDQLINGGVHILFAFNNLSNEFLTDLTALNQPIEVKSNKYVFTQLESNMKKTCLELVITLLNTKYHFLEQLKQLFQQYLGGLELSEVQPLEYRAKMYFILATIYKLENKFIESVCSVHNAMLSYPYSTVMYSVVLFLNHSNFHSTVRQSLINEIRNDSLHLTDITLPTQMKNLKFLERTEHLRSLKTYERAIMKQVKDQHPIQTAFSYIDLNMIVSTSVSLVPMNLTMSCLHFFRAMTNLQCTSAELYAYRSIIIDLANEIFIYAKHHLSLYLQIYIYKLLYTVILRSTDLFVQRAILTKNTARCNEQYIINDVHETLLNELLRNILQLSKVNPFTHAPSISTVYDLVYMESAGNELLEMYLKLKPTTSTIYQYYYFDGVWKGWIDRTKFSDERRKCMQNLLSDQHWSMNDVETLLCWPIIPRTDDGWLQNTKHRLQLGQPAYAQVIGITLNNETGDMEFMFTQAKKNEHNLFDTTDVVDVLRNGITYAHFMLDQPSKNYHSHPFYEMKYSPKRLSQAPNYLATLLHVDYLLNMLVTGVEICSLQPFEMRSSTENLLQRLPTYIREEIQAIQIKSSSRFIPDSMYRFWIQPQSSIEYEQTYHTNLFGRVNKNIAQFYLNDNLQMCVKQQRMTYDEMGNLIDTTNDIDDQSAEAQYARIFTKYYDEIGKYFPELLRLKELYKLSILSRIIQAKYKGQCKLISRIKNDSKLDEHLKHVKRSVNRSNEPNEKTFKDLSTILCKTYLCKQSNLKPYLMNWFKCERDESLKQYVIESLIEKKTKLKSTIEKLNFFIKDNDDFDNIMSNDCSTCSWVPATFSFDSNMKVYGSIAFNGNMKQVAGIKDMQEKSKSIIRIDGNRLSANFDKQKANDKMENMNNGKDKMRLYGAGYRLQRDKIERQSFAIESNVKVTTHSKTKNEARKRALECNGLSSNAELFDTDEIDEHSCSSIAHTKSVQEAYWHPKGYLVWLRSNSGRTFNERQSKGNTNASGTEKAYFSVFYQKSTGIEETEQYHSFDNQD